MSKDQKRYPPLDTSDIMQLLLRSTLKHGFDVTVKDAEDPAVKYIVTLPRLNTVKPDAN